MVKNIIIIEDEKPNADRLVRLLRAQIPNVNILAVLDSISESVKWFQNNACPDVVMMDVRLTDGLSFGIFEKVSIDCPVIFTTAYDEYALQAFKHNGIDYLLKPIESEELEKSLNKLSKAGALYDDGALNRLLTELKPKNYKNKFLLPFRDGFKVIDVSDILYIEMDNRIATAYLKNGAEAILPNSLEEIEEQLDPKLFFRANRQFIIHVNAVKQLLNYFNGKLKVLLKDKDVEVIVSRDKSAGLKEWLAQ
ncbi:LytTR family DNA-binding domain-containing protein [Pedobacter aquatilis]|uniref:LytR/AlgR family response regulator transcription factor n=1 Tax=Pedobacter aquatilis TaxID=351343 RepID=UPI00292DF997|nr:LytTR family DNA-binding domain-containing protein [Pedobacter aquatilis]